MSITRALGSGFVGACTATILNETARRVVPEAPRMEVLGMRGIARLFQATGKKAPRKQKLYPMAMVGDLVSNTLYYSLVAVGDPERPLLRGALLGAGAGVGGVVLPGPLGLGSRPSARTSQTRAMTVAWYLAAGLAAAAAYQLMRDDE